MQCLAELVVLFTGFLVSSRSVYCVYEPNHDTGYSAGLIPECPGMMKNTTISANGMSSLQIVMHSLVNGQIRRNKMPILTAHKIISKNKLIDFKKKTVIYTCGFLDSSVWPQTQAVANSYLKHGYNVFVTETFKFFSYIYPKSARLTKVIGRKLAEFIVRLMDQGLDIDKLELIGASLGAHTAAHTAKYIYSTTGKKPSRITGLDPAGPCFRSLPPEERLQPSDAQRVDVLHTNIDGFGLAERSGHLDFYANGGEFQPGDIPYIPCLVICSHFRAIFYWWMALEHPKKFIGLKCNSIQDARLARCYDSPVTNLLGLSANFTEPGVYYLPTYNQFPYYRGKDGLDKNNEIYKSIISGINSDDVFEA